MAAKNRQRKVAPKFCTIDLSKIDWEQLRKQKEWLAKIALEHVSSTGVKSLHPHAEGLLGLLDYLMDEAANLGTEVVFGKAMAKSLGKDAVKV